MQKKEILLTYFDDIITKDVVERYRVRKIEELKALAKFYLTNISSPITFNSLRKFLKISVDTIKGFSSYLEDVFLIFFLRMYHPSLKAQEVAPRKVYCIDSGLANAVGFRISKNRGKLMENVVASHLFISKFLNPDLEIFFWREYGKAEGKEVDFVIKEGLRVKRLIQVSYASAREAKKRLKVRK